MHVAMALLFCDLVLKPNFNVLIEYLFLMISFRMIDY